MVWKLSVKVKLWPDRTKFNCYWIHLLAMHCEAGFLIPTQVSEKPPIVTKMLSQHIDEWASPCTDKSFRSSGKGLFYLSAASCTPVLTYDFIRKWQATCVTLSTLNCICFLYKKYIYLTKKQHEHNLNQEEKSKMDLFFLWSPDRTDQTTCTNTRKQSRKFSKAFRFFFFFLSMYLFYYDVQIPDKQELAVLALSVLF